MCCWEVRWKVLLGITVSDQAVIQWADHEHELEHAFCHSELSVEVMDK